MGAPARVAAGGAATVVTDVTDVPQDRRVQTQTEVVGVKRGIPTTCPEEEPDRSPR